MVETIRRVNGFRDLASKQAVEHAIMAGRGNVDLLLWLVKLLCCAVATGRGCQHGCDDSDLPHDVRGQHSCDGLVETWDLNGRGERIRTSDPLVPNQVRYQTALRPEKMLR
jgi:hypothetical protein